MGNGKHTQFLWRQCLQIDPKKCISSFSLRHLTQINMILCAEKKRRVTQFIQKHTTWPVNFGYVLIKSSERIWHDTTLIANTILLQPMGYYACDPNSFMSVDGHLSSPGEWPKYALSGRVSVQDRLSRKYSHNLLTSTMKRLNSGSKPMVQPSMKTSRPSWNSSWKSSWNIGWSSKAWILGPGRH